MAAPALLPAPVRPAPPPALRAAPRPTVDRRLGVAAILVSATAMGAAGVFGRLATPTGAVVGEALTLGRMLAGVVGMLVVLAATRRLRHLRRVRLSSSVVLGGVFLGLSLATYLSATVLTDLSRAVVLHYLGPVVATVLARVVLGERTTRAEAASLAASFGGMVLDAGLVDGGAAPTSSDDALGTLLATLSGVLYGAALLTYRRRADVPADVRSFWNFVFGAVATGVMVAVVRPDLSGMTTTHWAWALAFFLVCGLLALGLLVVAGKHLRAAELSALSFWEVVVAVLLGAAVFGEAVSPLAAVGVAVVTAGALGPVLAGRSRAGASHRPSGAPGGRVKNS